MGDANTIDSRRRKLNEKEQNVYDLIIKGHDYYKRQDEKYKLIVIVSKIVVLLLSVTSTIVFGWKGCITETIKINIGLVIVAIISLITALSAFFNFDKYWMRNIKCHIRFNIMRDSFIYETTKSESLSDERIDYYFNQMKEIQENNIIYWQKAIDRAE